MWAEQRTTLGGRAGEDTMSLVERTNIQVLQKSWVWFQVDSFNQFGKSGRQEKCFCTREEDFLTFNMMGSGAFHYVPLPFAVDSN